MNVSIKPRVLVIEDEAALLALLRYNREKENYIGDEAMDGEQALLKVAEHLPDLILLDWMLPRLSGLEVCRQLRRDPNARTVPIIMLTARGEEADRVRGLDARADDYIAKPFSPGEMQLGRAAGRERVGQYGEISVVGVPFKKKKKE